MERGAVIVAGFGFRKGTELSSLREAFALAQEGLEPVTRLATVQGKIGDLRSLAEALGLPMTEVLPKALASAQTLTQSATSFAARGTGSVAEASALAAAGPGALLLRSRQISPDRMATCAIAQGTAT